jgi:hypothetical protein
MTTGDAYEGIDEHGVERPCAVCGHADADHVITELGETGTALARRATRCVSCEDWHDFVPRPQDE